ncbi:MAG: hypothetical protein H0W65_06195 [Sphingomonas sp.]|uniref:hypothetical protein n=1 Tax=Sphingomonas sp. TaxID=28214 RepID=UPI0018193C7A|nr:hypothetical protein [Sphingomonas sp.]MBA3667296.1 hypothetical protein [Sphingomonas sp.]
MRILFALAALPALSGCVVGTIASTAVDVVTLPVKAASAGVDAVTTSQAEADQKRGRDLRKAEEAAGRLAREREKACARARSSGEPCAVQPPPR